MGSGQLNLVASLSMKEAVLAFDNAQSLKAYIHELSIVV